MWSNLNLFNSSSARCSISFSCAFQRNGNKPFHQRSPTWCVAPSFMFSITDIFVRLLVNWNVRTIPIEAVLCATTFANERPSKRHSPVSGVSKPVSKLNNVVLPAPLGPIKAVIEPRCTSTCSTSTAVTPPKFFFTLSANKIGSGLATPGVGCTPASAARARWAVSV